MTAAADGYYRSGHAPPRTNGAGDTACGAAAPPPWLFAGMIARSEVMQRVFDHVRRLAAGTTPVLVVGETGTGKELVAHAIHEYGPRRIRTAASASAWARSGRSSGRLSSSSSAI